MANEMRLIDANDFLDLFYVASAGQDKAFVKTVEMCVEDTPTVDAVEVAHGKWALVEYQSSPFGVDQEYQCSICGTPVDDENYRTRYCPNCGAKMDGGVDSGTD